jgi:hypothetical protein
LGRHAEGAEGIFTVRVNVNGMVSKVKKLIAVKVFFEKKLLCVVLADGREVLVPLEFYPRLKNATHPQRKNYQLIGHGTGIHWPDVDEDLSVEGLYLESPVDFKIYPAATVDKFLRSPLPGWYQNKLSSSG